ncbi:MAG: hypothetical protein KGI49_03445 [Patescibacteria group bacterium]|nr:hypothetical protein [Patescibacteria group bacterium]
MKNERKSVHYVQINGLHSIELTNDEWYQDRDVISAVSEYMREHGRVYMDDKAKCDVLDKFGTRLLIRTARFIAAAVEDDISDAYISEDKRYALEFIVGVLKVRVRNPRHKEAFIDMEFSPKNRRIRFLVGERL